MPLVFAGGIGIWPFGFVVVWAMAGDVSDGCVGVIALGMVIVLEPSLFAYFEEALGIGDAEGCAGWGR